MAYYGSKAWFERIINNQVPLHTWIGGLKLFNQLTQGVRGHINCFHAVSILT
jgi:hypothetical protein